MILTVAREEGLRQRLTAVLGPTGWGASVTHADTIGEAHEILRGTGVVRAVLVGPSIGLDGASDLARTAASVRHPPPILLVGSPTTETLRAAMRAGIRDVLQPDFEDEDLLHALMEAGVDSDGPPALPGLTVAVFSSKGGVGTSVVASNLAIRLGARTGARVTLVDLDLASADQAIMHGQAPRWTIQDLADGTVARDPEALSQVLVGVPGTKARLLAGPVDPALAETITGTHVASIVAAVRAEAPVAVLDTASSFDDRTLAALDAADCVIVTSSLDVAALRGLTVSLQTLARLGVDDARICLALVRADSKSGLLVSDVEAAIGREIDVGIPSTRTVPRSVNEGTPLAAGTGRSSVVSAIDEIVDYALSHASPEFLDEARVADGGGGLFGWSRRGRSKQETSAAPEAPTAADLRAPDDATPASPSAAHEPPGGHEAAEADNVLPIDGRRSEAQTVRRRVVRSGKPADAEADEESDEESVSESPTAERKAPPSVADLPPPTVVDDDEDGQPRRRRRR